MLRLASTFLFFFLSLVTLSLQNDALAQTVQPDDSSQFTQYKVMKYRASETREFDLLHTQLEVYFDWNKEQLHGVAQLSLKPLFYDQKELVLDAKAMEIRSVKLINRKINQTIPLAYQYDKRKIKIDLGKVYTRSDTLTLSIDYIAKPNELEAGGSEAITSEKGLYFINSDGADSEKPKQIWTQGETEASSVWFPTIDAPNERCTQGISITVQNQFNTLSNGLLVNQKDNGDGTRTDTWELDIPHAPYLFMMSVGEYSVIEDKWEDIPLAYHVEPEFEKDADKIFGHTPEMMGYFSELLGVKYPWPKYDQVVVRDFVSGAMENTTASVFMESLHITEKELLDFNWDDIIAHELFHQWFGDYVTCESWSNLTLNEGFASYSEYLWNEYKYGIDEADYNLYNDRLAYFEEASETPKDLIRFYYKDKEDMFDSHSYNKGAAVLHMLRNYLGDEAFFAGLNLYLKANALQSVELADLRLSFESICGQDLNWFFDQWYFFPGHPLITIEENYATDTLTLTISQAQQGDVPVYRLPVFLEIWSEGTKQSYPIVLEDSVEEYEFYMELAPDLVVFDPEQHLLAEVSHRKTSQAYAYQMKNATSVLSRLETMEALSEIRDKKIIQSILITALNDPYEMIQELALEYMIENEIKPKKYQSLVNKSYSHTSSGVRSMALSYLVETDLEGHKQKLEASLSDPSYLVQGTALAYWTENEFVLSEDQLTEFSAATNVNIVLPMAEYYIGMSSEESYRWFIDKFKEVNSEALYFILQSYVEKLLNASQNRRKEAVDLYADYAKNHPMYFVRLASYQCLVLLTDMEGVNQMLIDIKESESDERLIEYYEQF